MAFLSYLQPARDLLFKENNVQGAEEALKPHLDKSGNPTEQRAVGELMGLILRKQKRFEEALQLYENIRDDYQAGYCAMLIGNMPQVQTFWSRVLLERQNHWCISLYGMITQQLKTFPTLFQIRNYMESDIANLIDAEQRGYLDNLLQYVDFLTQLNLEAPKFAGRALLNAGWTDKAGGYLMKGQKALPNDPEIYFHLGQFGVALNHPDEARLMLQQCLMISPTYLPARELLNQITEGAA